MYTNGHKTFVNLEGVDALAEVTAHVRQFFFIFFFKSFIFSVYRGAVDQDFLGE